MAQPRQRRALLGRLAGLGWFAQHGEVAATQSLAMLLEEPALKQALIEHVGALTTTDLRAIESFHAELIHDDRSRPDLEGQDNLERPLVVVEAKFTADLTSGQVLAYLNDQERRLRGEVPGAFVLLVPPHREQEANDRLLAAVEQAPADGSKGAVSSAVITWDDWLDVWNKAAQELPEDERAAVMGDLVQLRELCLTMRGLDIEPLGQAAHGDWQDRKRDLHRLVDQITLQLSDSSSRLLPTGTEPRFDFFRRYVPGGYADSYCAVGVVGKFADSQTTPFWLRYHKDTSHFSTIRERIMASGFAAESRLDAGHIWLPLRASDDVSGAAVVRELVDQVREIQEVAAGPEPSQPRPS